MIKFAQLVENNKYYAIIDFDSKSNCSSCKNHCEKNLLNLDFFKNKSSQVMISKSIKPDNAVTIFDESKFFQKPLESGTKIGVEFDDFQMLKLSLKLYGMPLVLMIVGLVGFLLMLNQSNLNMDLIGFLGMGFGFLMSYILLKSTNTNHLLSVKFFN